MDLMQAHQVKKPHARHVTRDTQLGEYRLEQPKWLVYDETGSVFADTLDEAYRGWVELYINFALYRG